MQHGNANNDGFRENVVSATVYIYVFMYINNNACSPLLTMIQDDENKLSINNEYMVQIQCVHSIMKITRYLSNIN